MAIQQKSPSPQEIKSDTFSFDKKEINKLKELQKNINQITFEFGQLLINKIKLEETETSLKQKLINLEKEESNLANNLSDKYGKGTINLDSGTFTPME